MTGTILVFGRTGQVAQALAEAQPPGGFRLEFAGRDRCDLLTTNPSPLIARTRPAAVINAAAYTAVDKAESEPEAAYRLNCDVVGEMAHACAVAGIPFVHISSDYVFDGEKPEPYVETDVRRPINVYGASKAAGEDVVENEGDCWTIFRTSWVLSPNGSNFINTIRRLAADRDPIPVVDDQWGRPTLAADIAALSLEATLRGIVRDQSIQGVFHLAGADDATWADLAEQVLRRLKRRIGHVNVVKRIGRADYPTRAHRPANSRLDTIKLQAASDWTPRPWREALEICFPSNVTPTATGGP